MATTTVPFPITIKDTDAPRVIAALKRKFGMPTGSDAEVIETLRQQFCLTLENLVFEAETEAAEEAVSKITKIDAT